MSVPNGSEFKEIADTLTKNWSSIGVRVNIQVYELGDFYQSVLRTRKFDAILFGQKILKIFMRSGISSQKNYPGSNFSMYVNSKADQVLEEEE